MVEVTDLVKNYGNSKALKGISFKASEGKIIGLLGVNGAGKSTTMNIMTGYISATSGNVKIDDCDILDNPLKAKAKIGYLPEFPPLYGDMTVNEYLTFAGRLKGLKSKELKDEIKRVIEAVSIEDKKNKLIKTLSKGYKQRAGLAQALIGNPPLLILDEPMVGLDPNQIIEIRGLIKKLGKKHTVILSSHILSEVDAICDYLIIINDGEIIAEGSADELSKEYSDSNKVVMLIKGDKKAIESALSKTGLLTNIEIQKEVEPGVYEVIAKSKRKDDIREKLFYDLAQSKLPLIKIENNSMSLEDVFIKLTENKENETDKKNSAANKKKDKTEDTNRIKEADKIKDTNKSKEDKTTEISKSKEADKVEDTNKSKEADKAKKVKRTGGNKK